MTNREEYLNKLSDSCLAELIFGYRSCLFCPFDMLDTCVQGKCTEETCVKDIEKWLGEKA